VVQVVSILGYAWLAQTDRPDLGRLAVVIGFEALGVGLGTAAFAAFIARATDPRYTATQFALFTSLAAVPRTLVNASTGFIVERIGWFDFFLLCTLLALPGMALLWKVAPWRERPPVAPPVTSGGRA
jgi:PAT family beta-lactamase induction signal transducer AmpG